MIIKRVCCTWSDFSWCLWMPSLNSVLLRNCSIFVSFLYFKFEMQISQALVCTSVRHREARRWPCRDANSRPPLSPSCFPFLSIGRWGSSAVGQSMPGGSHYQCVKYILPQRCQSTQWCWGVPVSFSQHGVPLRATPPTRPPSSRRHVRPSLFSVRGEWRRWPAVWLAAPICLSLPYTEYPVLYLYIQSLVRTLWVTILHTLVCEQWLVPSVWRWQVVGVGGTGCKYVWEKERERVCPSNMEE